MPALLGALCAGLALVTSSLPHQVCQKPRLADSPWFCHDLDCPHYDLVQTLDVDLELRAYRAGTWMSTTVKGVSYDKAVSTGFMRLFKYISGANEGSHKIPMTAPVRVKLLPGTGPFCEDTFVVSFFAPLDMQENPPAPNDPEIVVDPTPETDFYVLSYGGRTNEKVLLEKATALVAYLAEHDMPYSYDYFYAAGYDSPFRIFNRHNEIWIPARS